MDEPLSQPLLEERRARAKARLAAHTNPPPQPLLPPLSQADLDRVRDNAANGLPLWHKVWEHGAEAEMARTPSPPDFSEITRNISRSS